VIYLGDGVLAWTAAKMMISEPMSKDWLSSQNPALEYVIQVAVVSGVLLGGYMASKRAVEAGSPLG
jgi:predicted tellurium resistance membrane protein TerC